jgi:hypothetical protein
MIAIKHYLLLLLFLLNNGWRWNPVSPLSLSLLKEAVNEGENVELLLMLFVVVDDGVWCSTKQKNEIEEQ